jgi:hypothetical protein
MRNRLSAGVFLFLFVLSLPALAQMRGQRMMGQRAVVGEGENPLGLTADQMTKIRTINLQFEKDMITLRSNLQTKRLELLGLVESNADQKNIDAAVAEMTQGMGEIIKASLAHWRNVREVLTPDQRSRLDRMMGPGMGMGFGMGMGMGMRRGMMRGWGPDMGMGRNWMGMDSDDDGGRGWGIGMWRNKCPRWW